MRSTSYVVCVSSLTDRALRPVLCALHACARPPLSPVLSRSISLAPSLSLYVAERVLVVLRDGRHLVGLMRSFDQFSNFVLEETAERWYVGDMYGDVRLGLYVLRGENVVMLGELGSEEEEEATLLAKGLRRVSAEDILLAKQGLLESGAAAPGFTDWKTFDQIEGPSS